MKKLAEYETPITEAMVARPSSVLRGSSAKQERREIRDLERKLKMCQDALEYYAGAPWAPYMAGRSTDFGKMANEALEQTK